MIIDFHVNFGKGESMEDPLSNIDAKTILKYASEANVTYSVLNPVKYNDYSKANEEVSQAVKEFGNKLIGLARVNPRDENARSDLKKALENLGLKGLRLRPGHDGFSLNDANVLDLIQNCENYNVPLIIDAVKDVNQIIKLVKDNPTTTIVLMHLGDFGNFDSKNVKSYVEMVVTHENFYLGTCFFVIQGLFEEAAKKAPHKILFGSDSPNLHPAVEIEKIRVLNLPATLENQILGANARKLLKI